MANQLDFDETENYTPLCIHSYLKLLQLSLFGVTTMGGSYGNKANLSPAGAVVSLAIKVSVCGCSRYITDIFKTHF